MKKLALAAALISASIASTTVLAETDNQFKCSSGWDGSLIKAKNYQSAFKYKIDNMLADPRSYEHIETRLTKVKDTGEQGFIVKFRAKNKFGGYVVSEAIGTIDNQTCNILTITITN
jgi:hypothetical protein